MKLLGMFVVCVFLATSLVAGVAEAEDFLLTGNQHLAVTTSYVTGTLYDYSTADVLSGGYITHAYAVDLSTLTVTDGVVTYLDAYATGVANISGGYVDHLAAYENSVANISGGSVRDRLATFDNGVANLSNGSVYDIGAYGASVVNMSGGSASYLNAYDTSIANISGGSVSGTLYATQNGVANISGGSVTSLLPRDSSILNISGGIVSQLQAQGTSTTTFYGYDFRATEGLILTGQRVVGTGILTGKWFDGTSWATTIAGTAPSAMIRVQIVPEPSSLLALFIGMGGIGGMVWRRKR